MCDLPLFYQGGKNSVQIQFKLIWGDYNVEVSDQNIVFLVLLIYISSIGSLGILAFLWYYTAQKMKFSIKDFFSKGDQIRRKLRIWSHLLKKSLMENFIFCAVLVFFQAVL